MSVVSRSFLISIKIVQCNYHNKWQHLSISYTFYTDCVFNCVSYITYDRIHSYHDILDPYSNKFHNRSKIFKKILEIRLKKIGITLNG